MLGLLQYPLRIEKFSFQFPAAAGSGGWWVECLTDAGFFVSLKISLSWWNPSEGLPLTMPLPGKHTSLLDGKP